MKIRWIADRTGLDLKPTWEVTSVQILLAKNVQDPKNSSHRRDVMFLVIKANMEQIRKLQDDYGRKNMPTGILGITAIPLDTGEPLWINNPGYGQKVETYYGVEVVDDDKAPA